MSELGEGLEELLEAYHGWAEQAAEESGSPSAALAGMDLGQLEELARRDSRARRWWAWCAAQEQIRSEPEGTPLGKFWQSASEVRVFELALAIEQVADLPDGFERLLEHPAPGQELASAIQQRRVPLSTAPIR